MNPVLAPIYGPIAIHIYGLCIAIGGLIAFYLLCHDQKIKSFASESTIVALFQIVTISGFLGGRIGYILSQPESFDDIWFIVKFWEPGLSVLGALIGVVIALSSYVWLNKIPWLLLLDRVALYIPIAQGFGRLGCFFTGCCHGIVTTGWYSVTYTHPNNLAPLHCALHPAQLYSSIILFSIFVVLYFYVQPRFKTAGMITCSYILLSSLERFLIDFIRGDRILLTDQQWLSLLSVHQWLALAIIIITSIAMWILQKRR